MLTGKNSQIKQENGEGNSPKTNDFSPGGAMVSMVANIPASTALQQSCQSRIASPLVPLEKDERWSASLPLSSTTLIISRIASVDNSLENERELVNFTAVVDFPTAVAPAILATPKAQ